MIRLTKLIGHADITTAVRGVAHTISYNLEGVDDVVAMPIMFGAFMFAGDLLRCLSVIKPEVNVEVRPIYAYSYHGSKRGQLTIEAFESVKDRNVVVLEDIVDRGHTLSGVLPLIGATQPRRLIVASMFRKELTVDQSIIVGINLPADKFVVGYGLDFNGYYRNLPDLYTIEER